MTDTFVRWKRVLEGIHKYRGPSHPTASQYGLSQLGVAESMVRCFSGILILTILLVGAVLSLTVRGQGGAGCDTNTCTVNVSRTISTTSWGTTVINDTITIASSNASINQMLLGFPSQIGPNVRNVTAIDLQNGKSLTVAPTVPPGSNYTAFEVSFPSKKSPPAYSFLLRTILTDLLNFNPGRNQFNFTFSPFPVANFPIAQASLSVNVKGWSNPTASNIVGNFTNGIFATSPSPVNPFDTRVSRITFSTSGSQNVIDGLADRTVTIAPSGVVTVNDNYNITNHGPSLPNVAFTLPKDVKSVTGSDAVGVLDSTNIVSGSQSSTNSTWKVSPRYGSIGTNQSMAVNLKYDLPSSIVSSPSPGSYGLNFELFENTQFYQSVLRTKIVTPTGFRQNSLLSAVPYTISGNQILFQVSPVTPFSNLSFSMSYGLSPFWASFSPLAWTILVELAVVFAVLVFQPSTETALVSGGPAEVIRRYVDFNDEKATLRQEADRMEEDMSRGAVNRHEYKRRRRLADIRMAELQRTLGPVKSQLSNSGARYLDLVRRVERAEADLQAVRVGIADLRNQYRAGRMEKQLYESLTADLDRRKIRNKQTIDNVMITLREEVR